MQQKEANMIIIPKGTPTANRSKLSKDELRHFRTLETQFRQTELTWNQTINDDRVMALQVIQTIRNAPTVCDKSPYEQWLCDMWNGELAIDWPQIEAENQVIADREMEKIRQRRKCTLRCA